MSQSNNITRYFLHMNITAKTKICMTIGDPIEHSLSPQIHNAGLVTLGLDDQYVFVGGHVKIENIQDFIKGVRAINIHFIGCTMPHKIAVMQYVDKIDDVAKKIGAVNAIINKNNVLMATNTDWLGIVTPLEKITKLKNKTVALLGAGGAARAAAYGITKKGAKLQIYNRTPGKAEKLAKEFGGTGFSFDELERIKKADIIINTTSVGMRPKENETPLPKKFLTDKQVVLDAVYMPYETLLLKNAKEQGATIIHGIEMFLAQAAAQFPMYTGMDAPIDAMRKTLMENIT
jgi:shikimate dehydrogenase